MATDRPVLSRLEGVSPDDVREELATVRSERERLETEEEFLTRLLDLVLQRTGGTSKEEEPAATVVEPASAGDSGPDLRLPDGTEVEFKAATSNREKMLFIISTKPDRPWRAPEVHDELEKRGVEMSRENVRMTLRRLTDAGRLEKVRQGQFRLPRAREDAA